MIRGSLLLFVLAACAAPSRPAAEEVAGTEPAIIFAVPQEAPVAEDIVREDTTIVADWGLDLIERTRCRPYSDVCSSELLVQEAAGRRRMLADGLQGPFILFHDAQRIFSCEANYIMTTRGPNLIDLSGEVRDLPEHPSYLRECRPIGDGEEVLLVYNFGNGGPLYNVVRVFGSSGAMLLDERMDSAGTVEVAGKSGVYSVNVPKPEVPG